MRARTRPRKGRELKRRPALVGGSNWMEQPRVAESASHHTGRAREGSQQRVGYRARRKSIGHRGTGAGEGALQIVCGRRVVPWKTGAALLEDGFHHDGGETGAQQFLGDPKVGDAPIRMGKTLRDAKALQPTLIDGGSARHRAGYQSWLQ